MLQGQGSLQAPRGDSIAQAEADAVPASSGRNLLAQPPLLQEFGIPEGWQELEGEQAPGVVGTPGMGQDPGNATGWQWALNLLCQPGRETCREEILGWQLQEFQLIFHSYSSPWCHFPHAEGHRAALN